MAHKHKKSQGKGYVTHRSRGRFTLVSPQNLTLPSTKAMFAAPQASPRAVKPPKPKLVRTHDTFVCHVCREKKSILKMVRKMCRPCDRKETARVERSLSKVRLASGGKPGEPWILEGA